MTQRHVEVSRIESNTHQINLDINEDFSIIVKRFRHQVYVLLQNKSKCLKFPMDEFQSICESQISVAYAKSILESEVKGLCCYCRLQFISKDKCLQHEENEHLAITEQENEACFHRNYLEREYCLQCNPFMFE